MASRAARQDMASSPILGQMEPLSPSRRRGVNTKERRNPSITPRKFRRFFTPRSRVSSSHISPARKALRDLAAPQINNRYQTPADSSPLKPVLEDEYQEENLDTPRFSKRRKTHHTPDSSPCRPAHHQLAATLKPSIEAKPALLSPIKSLHSSQELQESDDETDEDLGSDIGPIKRLVPLPSRGLSGQLLQRRLGAMPRAGRSHFACPVSDWRGETAGLYSRPSDVHSCTSHDNPGGRCIPFCAATCHTNSLVAVGDEEGRVRLLESSGSASEPFSKIHLSFQAHSNAVIDLAFSDDDYLLATASGDQTGRVVDMMTQTPLAILHQHTASIKQVRFQPGVANSSVLATSSRDGSIQIWDLRCKGAPVQDIITPNERDTALRFRLPPPKQGCAVNSIYDAHTRSIRQNRQVATAISGDTPSRSEIPGRVGDVSVTALQFLPAGREHLLLSACESDASVKLWDIRAMHTSRHRAATPLSATDPPYSHSQWRPFGISSLALSTDGARLYALCKDNTVYTYSTPHLILGHAQDLSMKQSELPRRRHGTTTQQGLGPMYGFRHPQFHATSFYVKCAVRPARDGRSELLAVGSSDHCAVVFPTAERYFRDDLSGAMGSLSLENSTIAASVRPSAAGMGSTTSVRRPLFRTNSSSNFSGRLTDNIPIIQNGTPLVRGHEREVGALSWTNQGKLVTVGDDYLVRCWTEDAEQARDLRTGGETEGRRWGCGWADVAEDWDASDDEE